MSRGALTRTLSLLFVLAMGCPRPPTLDAGTTLDAGASGCSAGCAQGARCVRDTCFPVTCGAVACGADEVCEDDVCVSVACAGLLCAEGSRCLRGECFADLCGATVCGEGRVCDGAQCVEAACAGVQCGEGSTCRGGRCDQCLAGFIALDGGCGRLRPSGQSCGEGRECETGICSSGVCCLTPCLGQCEGCDSSGQCRSRARGEEGSPACFPGRCGGERLSCVEDCLLDSDCAAGAVCDRSGPSPRCLPKYRNGTACTQGTQCASGFCVGGRCCDTACEGTCATCNGLTSDGFPTGTPLGTCTPVPVGGTPASRCGDFLCDGLVQTCPTSCGTDRACRADRWCGPATCANPLLGNGAACDRGRQCLSGQCVDGFCCDSACTGECAACNLPGREGVCSGETGPRTADGGYCSEGIGCPQPCDGVCQECSTRVCRERIDNGRAGACGNFGCGGRFDAGCPTSCSTGTTEGCAQGFFCEPVGPGRCGLQRVVGAVCSSDPECQTGRCCGGYCVEVNDSNHCTGCGQACFPGAGGYQCQGGRCCEVCDGTNCIDVSSDLLNCGGCGTQCQSGQQCIGGQCCETCGTSSCVDLNYDSQNCGSCGVVCSGSCSLGVCS